MRRVRESTQKIAKYCNIEIAISIIGGKWKLIILKYLLPGRRRFGELKSLMPTISQRMLARQLRELEDDLLIERHVYPEVPPRVEYRLTEVGRSMEPLIHQLDTWGDWYRQHIESHDRNWDNKSNN